MSVQIVACRVCRVHFRSTEEGFGFGEDSECCSQECARVEYLSTSLWRLFEERLVGALGQIGASVQR